MSEEPEFYNVTETAAALGVNRRRVWQMVRSDDVESIKNPVDRRETLVPRSEIERLSKFAKKKP